MSALGWLLNLGFAGGGAVVAAAGKLYRILFGSENVQAPASFVKLNDEFILADDELIRTE